MKAPRRSHHRTATAPVRITCGGHPGVMTPISLTHRVTDLVDTLLDAGRRDEARVLFDALCTVRSIYVGTPATMDLAGSAQLLAEAAARIQAAAHRTRPSH